MRLRILLEPHHGATYAQILALAQAAEAGGFDAFFRSDHYLRMGSSDGLPGPTDAWITLAGLARETSRLRLGTLMSPITFRHPGPLAISVAQVDQMSGGRVELGIGSGWYEAEHTAYGIPFPALGERFDQYEEQVEIVDGLLRTPVGQTYSFAGKHYQVTDSPALPKAAQRPRPPILVGGGGAKRTPRLAARFADEFNIGFVSIEQANTQFDRVKAACSAIGRDPSSIVLSVAHPVVVGRDDAEVARRAAAIGRDLDELKLNGFAGTAAQVLDRIGSWHERAGVDRVYLQLLDLSDLDHLDFFASEVAAKWRA